MALRPKFDPKFGIWLIAKHGLILFVWCYTFWFHSMVLNYFQCYLKLTPKLGSFIRLRNLGQNLVFLNFWLSLIPKIVCVLLSFLGPTGRNNNIFHILGDRCHYSDMVLVKKIFLHPPIFAGGSVSSISPIFLTFSGRPNWLPRAMLLNVFDFLASLGKFLGVYFRNWPNFHFWASWKGSKMPKILKI